MAEGRGLLQSALQGKQFTTAGADIDLIEQRPGWGDGWDDKLTRRLVVTTSPPPGDLVLKDKDGLDHTINVPSVPFTLDFQASGIDSTSTAGIVLTAYW